MKGQETLSIGIKLAIVILFLAILIMIFFGSDMLNYFNNYFSNLGSGL